MPILSSLSSLSTATAHLPSESDLSHSSILRPLSSSSTKHLSTNHLGPHQFTSTHAPSHSDALLQNPMLTSKRPAPPSPSISRRASQATSAGSTRSRPTTSTTTIPSITTASAVPRIYIYVRDFAYSPTDERHKGLGPDVPYLNRVSALNRQLRAGAGELEESSTSDDDGDEGNHKDGDEMVEDREGEEGEEEDAWKMLRVGVVGRVSMIDHGNGHGGWGAALGGGKSAGDGGPSKSDLERNFGAQEGEEDESGNEYDEGDDDEAREEEDEEDEETLYPGLYRALYAFEPEGTAEMALVEDQVVRVMGRGGGVGWAVVVNDSVDSKTVGGERRFALVPESYLEAVKLDWEVEPEGVNGDVEEEGDE